MDLFVRFDEKKKTNFENFSVSQNLVIFKKKKKKGEFSLLFFLTPPFFRPKKDKLPKQITLTIPNDPNVGQNNFHDILIRIGGENPKC